MSEKIIRNDLLGEQYYEIDHKSGLKIFVMENLMPLMKKLLQLQS